MTIYYIRNGGNDLSSGLSHEAAWATLSKVSSHQSSSPGNEYWFAAGSSWYELLTLTGDSTSEIPTMLRAYWPTGEITPPTFRGDIVIDVGDWNDEGSNLWSCILNGITEVDDVYFGELIGIENQSPNSNYHWMFDESSETLIVYSISNPTTLYSSMKAVCRENIIIAEDVNGVDIRGIKFFRYFGAAIKIIGSGWNAWEIYRCLFDADVGYRRINCCAFETDGGDYDFKWNTITRNYYGVKHTSSTGRVQYCIFTGVHIGVHADDGNTVTYDNCNTFGCLNDCNWKPWLNNSNNHTIDPNLIRTLKHTGSNITNISMDALGHQFATVTTYTKNVAWAAEEEFQQRGSNYHITVGIVPGGIDIENGIVTEDDLRKMRDAGMELLNGGQSRSYINDTYKNYLAILSTGHITTATLSVSDNTLTTTIDSVEDLNVDLTDPLYDTLGKLVDYINAYGGYICATGYITGPGDGFINRGSMSDCLTNVTDANITSIYQAQADLQKFLQSEIEDGDANLKAIGITPSGVHPYPWGYYNTSHPTLLHNAGYIGGRSAASGHYSAPLYEPLCGNCDPFQMTSYKLFDQNDAYTYGRTPGRIKRYITNILMHAKVCGYIATFFCHAYESDQGPQFGYALDAIINFGFTYSTAQECAEFIRNGTEMVEDKIWGVATVDDIDVAIASSTSIAVGAGGIPIHSLDLKGNTVDLFSNTDNGATIYTSS